MRKMGWNYPFLVQSTKDGPSVRRRGVDQLWEEIRFSPGIPSRLAQVTRLSLLSCLGFSEKTKKYDFSVTSSDL